MLTHHKLGDGTIQVDGEIIAVSAIELVPSATLVALDAQRILASLKLSGHHFQAVGESEREAQALLDELRQRTMA